MTKKCILPSGVAPSGDGSTESALEHLRTIMLSRGVKADVVSAFVEHLDELVGGYRGARQVQDTALPRRVRQELNAACEASCKLVERVNALEGTSRQLLFGEGENRTFDRFMASLMFVESQLRQARQYAHGVAMTGGRPVNIAKIDLAARVAHAIRERLAVRPTSSPGGIFEEILATIIEAVADEGREGRSPRSEPSSVRHLMRAALKAKVTVYPGGLVEVDPLVD